MFMQRFCLLSDATFDVFVEELSTKLSEPAFLDVADKQVHCLLDNSFLAAIHELQDYAGPAQACGCLACISWQSRSLGDIYRSTCKFEAGQSSLRIHQRLSNARSSLLSAPTPSSPWDHRTKWQS